ncbi:peptidoglycan-binding LysM domain protein [Mycena maculata]|uniref:Peptidoglycan-binding LysM domain protein n=1 Tax=Mycena maculata TaxID=230809 RepID=A0AAD7KD70_9AGAR|nr:peptidoglycan-binding LysM domain protein [Mycena maculata]
MSNGHKPVTPESIYFNPFAEEGRHRTTAIDVPYFSGTNHRPVVKRRASGSDSTAPSSASSSSGLSVFTNTPRHMRIKTDSSTGVVESGGHHPLGSADLSAGFRNGAGVTRPQLTRILNIAPLVDVPPVPGADMIVAEPTGDEKVVLVHEVTLQDSLAGVSLKYGISMAELRRANHLWASDPIHLRRVLYIPLDKTSRAKELAPMPLLVSTEDTEQSSPSPTRPDNIPPVSTIRIPASQLSFFPPHSRPQRLPDPPSPPVQPIPRTKHPHSRHARYATTPTPGGTASSPSLTSILTALPIQPSTRDTIIARLSYDSTGTSNSSYSDQGEGHELDDVRRGASLDSVFPVGEHATSKAKGRAAGPSVPPTRSHVRTASASSVYASGGAQYRLAGPPRTVQLEPSPAMQLPFGSLRRKPRGDEHLNRDFDLLGLGEGEGETVDDS